MATSIAWRTSRIILPAFAAISGSFSGPKTMSAMTRTMKSSGICPNMESLSSIDGDVVTLRRPHVIRAWPVQPVVGILLHDVGDVAGEAADGKDRREEIVRNAEVVVNRRRVEVDVGKKSLLLLDHLFDARG